MKRGLKALALGAALLVLLTMVAASPIGDWLTYSLHWIDLHPRLSWLVFVAIYVVAAILIVPGSPLTLGAGFVFGLPLGVALVSVGSVLGAAAAFLLGRYLAREWISERLSQTARFRALDSATRHEGFAIVFLARLSPLFPFNLLNYGLGLTAVSFRDYMLATWLGMLPVTVLYVYVGTLAGSLTELTDGTFASGTMSRTFMIAGFVATVLVTILITRRANRALAAHLAREIETGSA